jgi:hypothetical protein
MNGQINSGEIMGEMTWQLALNDATLGREDEDGKVGMEGGTKFTRNAVAFWRERDGGSAAYPQCRCPGVFQTLTSRPPGNIAFRHVRIDLTLLLTLSLVQHPSPLPGPPSLSSSSSAPMQHSRRTLQSRAARPAAPHHIDGPERVEGVGVEHLLHRVGAAPAHTFRHRGCNLSLLSVHGPPPPLLK